MELQEPELELSAGGKFQGNFDEAKGNLVGVIRISRVKMTEKWDEIQGKLNLVRVGGECELSEFEI